MRVSDNAAGLESFAMSQTSVKPNWGQTFVQVEASRNEGGHGARGWNPGSQDPAANDLLDGAFETAEVYLDTTEAGGDDGKTFDLAKAVLGKDAVDAVVAQSATDKLVLDQLVAIELMILEAIKGDQLSDFMRPKIGFAPMDADVNGYFIPGKQEGEAGKIVLSEALKSEDEEFLEEVVLEELGEALAAYLETDEGVTLGEGDVGNRLMKVFLGEPFEEGDFTAKTSDTTLVRGDEFNGSVEIEEENDPHEDLLEDLFTDGGIGFDGSSLDASEAVQADILADNPNASVREGFPNLDWMENATAINVEDLDLESGPAIKVTGTWEFEQSVGGRQGAAGVTEIVEVSDSVTLKVKQVGDEKYLEVMLPKQVSNGKNLSEDRLQINPTYVASSQENAKKQFNHVKKAINTSAAAEPPAIHYSYERDHIGSQPDGEVGGADDPAPDDEASGIDLGIIGTGYTAYGVPDDATVNESTFMSAENNPSGRDVLFATYTRASEPDSEYFVTFDSTGNEYEVLSATVVNGSDDTMKVYGLDGSLIQETTLSEWDGLGSVIEGNNGAQIETEIIAGLDAGHTAVDGYSSPDVAFASFIDKDDGQEYIRYRTINEAGEFDAPITVLASSEEALNIYDMWDQSVLDTNLNADVGHRRLSVGGAVEIALDGAAVGEAALLGWTAASAVGGLAVQMTPIGWAMDIALVGAVIYANRGAIKNGARSFGSGVKSFMRATSNALGHAGTGDGTEDGKPVAVAVSKTGSTVQFGGGDSILGKRNDRTVDGAGGGDDDEPPRVTGEAEGTGHYVDVTASLRWNLVEYAHTVAAAIETINNIKQKIQGGNLSQNGMKKAMKAFGVTLNKRMEALKAKAEKLLTEYNAWAAGKSDADIKKTLGADFSAALSALTDIGSKGFVGKLTSFYTEFNARKGHANAEDQANWVRSISELQAAGDGDTPDGVMLQGEGQARTIREEVGVPNDYVPGGDLDYHEGIGGHLIGRHVGQSLEQLQGRTGVNNPSTFVDQASATRIAGQVLIQNADAIDVYLQSANQPNDLVLRGSDLGFTGRRLNDARDGLEDLTGALVRIIKDASDIGYRIITGYPE